MKIGFEETPAAPAGTYSRHLAKLLAEYAPEHEYIVDGARYKELDLYHGFRPGLPLPLLRRIPSVMTVDNLNFLRYPHLYSLPERLVLLRLYRRALRSASRLITVNRDAREELSERLRIDPGRIEGYGVTTVNYNRDVEIFPVLRAIFQQIFGESPYKSPTDMGVNMAGNCIIDDEACREASRQEIIRRYYQALNRVVKEDVGKEEVYKIELLMKQAKLTTDMRKVVPAALKRAEETGAPAAAIELPDGTIATGKTTNLLGASAALLLNAVKVLGNIPHDEHLISPIAIEPIQKLKVEYLGSRNPRLHTDEVLIALSMCAATNKHAQIALEQLEKLRGCQVHTSVMLSEVDIKTFKRLGIELTSEPVYEHNRLYQ